MFVEFLINNKFKLFRRNGQETRHETQVRC